MNATRSLAAHTSQHRTQGRGTEMNTPGPVALLGGHEHRRGTEAIERTLLDQLGAVAPRVTVQPVASPARQVGAAAALARNYWTGLGASVRIAMPDRNGSRGALEAVCDADVIVLTGGVPNRLVAALGASPVWDLILQRWRGGAAISGSSAGAMSLFAWRLKLYPPNPLELIPGLGPFDGYLAAPHFSRFRAERWATSVTRRFDGLGVLGLDEGAAIVGRDGHFTVAGTGAVTVIHDGRLTVHRPGTPLDLDLGNGMRAPARQPAVAASTLQRLVYGDTRPDTAATLTADHHPVAA
jgi:cyanophycinase-like exopeptidase